MPTFDELEIQMKEYLKENHRKDDLNCDTCTFRFTGCGGWSKIINGRNEKKTKNIIRYHDFPEGFKFNCQMHSNGHLIKSGRNYGTY